MQFNARDIFPISAIIGIVGLAVMGIKFWVGVPLFVLAIGLVLFAAKNKKPTQRTIPTAQTIVSEFEITEHPTLLQPITPAFYQPLLGALRVSGYNLDAPVIYTDGEPITAQDIIIQVAHIMQEKGDNIQAMTQHMPAMYNLLWDYTAEALQRYADLELIKVHIASSVYFNVKLEKISKL